MEVQTADKLRDLRQRVLAGGEYSVDELRDAIRVISNERVKELSASTGKTGAKRKAPVKPVSLDDLL